MKTWRRLDFDRGESERKTRRLLMIGEEFKQSKFKLEIWFYYISQH
jgi:hypothetical protein